MWVDPAGHRTLLAPSDAVADYVGGLYAFDDVRVVRLTGRVDARTVALRAGPLQIHLAAGDRTWRSWVFAARPRPLRRWPVWIAFEDRLVAPFGPLLLGGAPGVRLAGPTPGGRHEWYSIDDHRPLASGHLVVGGADAGRLARLRTGLGVGLSDFPTEPAMVTLTTLIEPRAAVISATTVRSG